MNIERVTVEVLETPVESQYTAAGNQVSTNYHVLARIFTGGGVQGIGFDVVFRPALVKSLAQTTQELGQLLIGMSVLEIEAARAKLERASGWAGPRSGEYGDGPLGYRHVGRQGQDLGTTTVPPLGRLQGPGPGLRQRLSLVQPAPGRAGTFCSGPRCSRLRHGQTAIGTRSQARRRGSEGTSGPRSRWTPGSDYGGRHGELE